SAGVGGGVFEFFGSDLTLVNSTLAGNSAAVSGGIHSYAKLTLVNSTVSGNSTLFGPALYASYSSGTATLTNSIVAGQSSGGDISAFSASGTNNLTGTGFAGGLANGVDGNLVGVTSPALAPVGNYGGPTPTVALLPGSPALNAGISTGAPATDQR